MDDFIKGDTSLIKDLTDELNRLQTKVAELTNNLNIANLELANKEQERLDTLNDNKYYKKLCSELTQQLAETDKLMQEYLSKCLSLEQQLEKKVEFGKFKSAEELLKAYQNLEREFTKSRQQLVKTNKERHEEWLTGKEWKWECDRLKKELHTAKQETLHFQNKYFAEKQIAIDELEKVIKFAKTQDEFGFRKSGMEIFMFVDQQIKSLKGETNEQK